jgi:hypothetical protein
VRQRLRARTPAAGEKLKNGVIRGEVRYSRVNAREWRPIRLAILFRYLVAANLCKCENAERKEKEASRDLLTGINIV